jgi:hypothetical protein
LTATKPLAVPNYIFVKGNLCELHQNFTYLPFALGTTAIAEALATLKFIGKQMDPSKDRLDIQISVQAH